MIEIANANPPIVSAHKNDTTEYPASEIRVNSNETNIVLSWGVKFYHIWMNDRSVSYLQFRNYG